MAARRISSRFANLVLVAVSVLSSAVAAEIVVRVVDDRPILAFPMPEEIGVATVPDALLDRVPIAAGVKRAWFFSDPPPLPNRSRPTDDEQRMFHFLDEHPSGHPEYRPADYFKAWNSVFAGDPCQHRFLRHAPGSVLLYDPPDGSAVPAYRFPPNITTPLGLVTNQMGWRGKPILVPRPPRTVRIVFAGASTTVDFHHFPFSFPEFVGHWLDLWAAAHHPDVRFEVLNASRESTTSTDIAAEIRNEVLPLRPELVVYHEGGNQFQLDSLLETPPAGAVARPSDVASSSHWLTDAARYSALARRIEAALGLAATGLEGGEWPKPAYRLVWPPGLDERDPDLGRADLPVNLSIIRRDLDRIRDDLATVGGELAISSFPWMVRDGLVLDPLRHKYILEHLNVGKHPFRYADLERLANFQNRALAKYARQHGLAFIDIAGGLPFAPDLFSDATHTNYAGSRLRAWVVLQQLIPVIEKHLADGSWPRPSAATPEVPLPTYVPRRLVLSCPKGV